MATVEPPEEKTAPPPAAVDRPPAWASPVISKGSGIKKKTPVAVKTGDRLGWVDNALKTYPPEQFVTGLGIAPTSKSAQKRAMKELVKPFDKAISGRLQTRQRTLGKLPTLLERKWDLLAEKSRAHALEVAMGPARVAELFIEKQPLPTVYALAVLNRSDAARLVRPMIQQLDHQLQALTEHADAVGKRSSINRHQLLQTLIRRESLDAAWSAAKPGGQGTPLSVHPRTIAHLLKKNRKNN